MSDEEDLRFNVLNHVTVPNHEVVPADEVPALLAQYKIVLEQFPKIRADDPAVRAVDGKAGDVIRITRESLTAGKHIAYRLAVQAL